MDKVVITCEELKDLIDSGADVRIFDASIEEKIDAQNRYESEHIPGALFFDLKQGAIPTEGIPLNVPTAEAFELHARGFVVNSDTPIVIYEVTGEYGGFWAAARLWWTFRYFGHENVRVLEGGLERWRRLGYPVTSEGTAMIMMMGSFEAKEQPNMRVNYDSICQLVSNPNEGVKLLDARGPPMYEKGHIPIAKNVPLSSLIDKETLKLPDRDQLAAKIKSIGGLDENKQVITSCMRGLSGAGLTCLAAAAGLDNWKLYVGGFMEWSAKHGSK